METKKKKKIILCNKNSTKTKDKPVSTSKETVVFLAISNKFRHSLQGVPGPLPLFFSRFSPNQFFALFPLLVDPLLCSPGGSSAGDMFT